MEKKYNPTITAFFDAPKFSKTGQDGEKYDAFISAEINAEAFATLQKHVTIGTKLLFRTSPKLNRNGGRTLYLEVLPPMTDTNNTKGRFTRDDSGI